MSDTQYSFNTFVDDALRDAEEVSHNNSSFHTHGSFLHTNNNTSPRPPRNLFMQSSPPRRFSTTFLCPMCEKDVRQVMLHSHIPKCYIEFCLSMQVFFFFFFLFCVNTFTLCRFVLFVCVQLVLDVPIILEIVFMLVVIQLLLLPQLPYLLATITTIPTTSTSTATITTFLPLHPSIMLLIQVLKVT